MLCADFVATQEDFLEVASADKWLGIGLAGPGITRFVVCPSHTFGPTGENAYCHPLKGQGHCLSAALYDMLLMSL